MAEKEKLSSQSINPLYLGKGTPEEAGKIYLQSFPQSIQLTGFLQKGAYQKLLQKAQAAHGKQKTSHGQYSYAAAEASEEMEKLFNAQKLHSILAAITGQKIKKQKTTHELLSFAHCDYTLLHNKLRQSPGIMLFLELTPLWDPSWGGYTSIIGTKSGKELLRINPVPNTLTIMRLEKNMKWFVKYVNHLTGRKKRVFILMK